jgi:hypothetical protein
MSPDRTKELYETTPLAQDASPEAAPPDPGEPAPEDVVEQRPADEEENEEGY